MVEQPQDAQGALVSKEIKSSYQDLSSFTGVSSSNYLKSKNSQEKYKKNKLNLNSFQTNVNN